jgi:hypothetical protein
VKKKPANRKDTEQLTIFIPRGLLAVLRPISLQLDLEADGFARSWVNSVSNQEVNLLWRK